MGYEWDPEKAIADAVGVFEDPLAITVPDDRHEEARSVTMGGMSTEYDFSKGKRGAVAPIPTGKTRITIRLDDEVLQWFRAQVHAAGGGNYQSLINRALREHMRRSAEPLEDTLRRILREEFRRELPTAKKMAPRRNVSR